MTNKKNISVRLTDSDLRSLKKLSARLHLKESDVFRFVVKSSMNRVLPLLHGDLKGIDFLINLLDCGEEILKYFEFDSHQIDRMTNKGAVNEDVVAMDDIELVAISAVNEDYLKSRLAEKTINVDGTSTIEVLKTYLIDKYVDKKVSL